MKNWPREHSVDCEYSRLTSFDSTWTKKLTNALIMTVNFEHHEHGNVSFRLGAFQLKNGHFIGYRRLYWNCLLLCKARFVGHSYFNTLNVIFFSSSSTSWLIECRINQFCTLWRFGILSLPGASYSAIYLSDLWRICGGSLSIRCLIWERVR